MSCDRRSSFLPMNLAYPGCLATVVCSVRVHPILAGRPVRRAVRITAACRRCMSRRQHTPVQARSTGTQRPAAMSPTPETLTGTPESRQSKFLGPGNSSTPRTIPCHRTVNLMPAAVKLIPGAVDLMRSSLTSAPMAPAALPGESRQQAAVPCASDWLSPARRSRRGLSDASLVRASLRHQFH